MIISKYHQCATETPKDFQVFCEKNVVIFLICFIHKRRAVKLLSLSLENQTFTTEYTTSLIEDISIRGIQTRSDTSEN